MTTMNYVDRLRGVSGNLAWKTPARVSTPDPVTLFGLQVINGYALADGDRVLVRSQMDARDNGIYVACPTQWRRSLDFNGAHDVVKGTAVYASEDRKYWRLVGVPNPIIGESSLEFEEFVDARNFMAVATRTALADVDPSASAIVHTDGVDWRWDPAVTVSQHSADTARLTMVPTDPEDNGAWVNPLADYRRGYWANSANPGLKHRVRSGIFVGPNAVRFLGATFGNNAATEFWVHQAGYGWWMHNAMNIFERDGGAINTAIISRGPTSGTGYTVGLIIGTVGRCTNSGNTSHCIYADSIGEAGHMSNLGVGEFEVINKRGPSSIAGGEKPYTLGTQLSYVLGVGAGGDATIHGVTDSVDTAFRFVNNGARFNTLFNIRSNALVFDPDNNEGRAMQLPQGAAFVWYGPGDVETARIVSKLGVGPAWKMSFGSVVAFQRGSKNVALIESVGDSATNFITIRNANSTVPPAIEATGTDAHVDLYLQPKGDGVLRISYTGTSTGSMVPNRRVAIKNGAGETLYLLAAAT